MLGKVSRLVGLLSMILCFAGCFTLPMYRKENVRPPEMPEEFILPPLDDPRYGVGSAHTYPKKVMYTERVRMEREKDASPIPGGNGPTFGNNRPGVGR